MFQKYFIRANTVLEKYMPLLTPTGVALGFLLGVRITGFAPAVTWLFAFITFIGALTMSLGDFVKVLRNPLPIFIFLAAFHIVLPLVSWAAASFIFPDNTAFITGFVLLFSIPTAVASFIWTGIHKGNGPLTLTIILIDTILAPIVTPFIVSVFMGKTVHIDGLGMFVSLVWMVVVPSVAGIALNQISKGRAPTTVVPYCKPISKIALLCVIAINSSRAAVSITEFEPIFIVIILLCVFLSFFGFAAGNLAARVARLNKTDGISLVFTVGMRNISAALVLALDFFEPRAALPVICGILFQQTLAAVAGLLFGEKKVGVTAATGKIENK